MKIAAVIPAGGVGTRLGAALPKQLLQIAGKPILLHTLERVLTLPELVQVVISLPGNHLRQAQSLLPRRFGKIPVRCVRGGDTRQESVFRGVKAVRKDVDLILVHDAVRPLCDTETMVRVVEAARSKGGAVPGLPATDTIQRVSSRGRVLKTPRREQLYAIQTPQAFRADVLRTALERAARAGFAGTDESSVVRWAGYPVIVVPGSRGNIKITGPLDLMMADLLLSAAEPERPLESVTGREPMARVGHGIDYHRLASGRRLVLGGVEIPFSKGLEGHSDADVLLHSICDALLGAAGLGDIGQHFPDSDPANRNRSSLEFLREVRDKVRRAGWVIRNLDATLLVQSPKIGPYMGAMRRNIAEALSLPESRVNVKATTTEGMNSEGRGEGISSQAVAMLERARTRPDQTRS